MVSRRLSCVRYRRPQIAQTHLEFASRALRGAGRPKPVRRARHQSYGMFHGPFDWLRVEGERCEVAKNPRCKIILVAAVGRQEGLFDQGALQQN